MPARNALGDSDLVLPPVYSVVTLREHGDAFAHAQAIAADAGAGTLVWVRRFDLVEFAVVLEPEEPLARARCAVFAGMNALADMLAVHCPPEKEVHFGWPVTLTFDGALLGGGRLAWPADCAEDAVPDWLVFGAMAIADTLDPANPGVTPGSTSLAEEGFADVTAADLVQSFASHLMAGFHTWQERGFGHLARTYLERLPAAEAGVRRGLDVNGDLLLRRGDSMDRVALLPGLDGTGWLDPETGAPRL